MCDSPRPQHNGANYKTETPSKMFRQRHPSSCGWALATLLAVVQLWLSNSHTSSCGLAVAGEQLHFQLRSSCRSRVLATLLAVIQLWLSPSHASSCGLAVAGFQPHFQLWSSCDWVLATLLHVHAVPGRINKTGQAFWNKASFRMYVIKLNSKPHNSLRIHYLSQLFPVILYENVYPIF